MKRIMNLVIFFFLIILSSSAFCQTDPPWEYEWNADEVPQPGPDYHYRGVLIARHETSPVISRPTDGIEYVDGDPIGESKAVYMGVGWPFFNWWWSWWDTHVVLGDTYYYKLFSRDESWNYSTGVETEGLTTKTSPTIQPLITPSPTPWSLAIHNPAYSRTACLAPDVELVSAGAGSQSVSINWIGPRDLVGWGCEGSECCTAGGGIVLLDTDSPSGPRKSYYYKAADFIIPFNQQYTIEFRMKVLDSPSLDGRLRFRSVAFDDYAAHILTLDFSDSQVKATRLSSDIFDLDTTDAFHIYRIVGRGRRVDFYIDGRHMLGGPTSNSNPEYDGIYFGDLIGGGSQSQWDYIRYTSGAYPYPSPTPLPAQIGDYDGDGTSDLAVFRPSSALWHIRGVTKVYFGSSEVVPAPKDYDGDGDWDMAWFRPSQGLWKVYDLSRFYFGSSSDSPIPGDYDGDGTDNAACFRPGTGLWSVRGLTRVYFGTTEDIPVPGDYSGDGSVDLAYFRPSGCLWKVKDLTRIYFGDSDSALVPADYDGDWVTDFACYRRSDGLWKVRELTRVYFGTSTDEPVPADYDGDGTCDFGYFRPSSILWKAKDITRVYFGQSGDIQVTNPYLPPTPLPTASVTPSVVPTPSSTPSVIPTPSLTPSVAPTPSPSSTVTPTPEGYKTPTPTPSVAPTPEPFIESSNTGCLGSYRTEGEPEWLEASWEADHINVRHYNAQYNCCLERVDVEMEVAGDQIRLYETEYVPIYCYCLCPCNVFSDIYTVNSGSYTISVYKEGSFWDSIEVEVP